MSVVASSRPIIAPELLSRLRNQIRAMTQQANAVVIRDYRISG